jgi:hypothetical protein
MVTRSERSTTTPILSPYRHNDKYSIIIEAPGYTTAKYLIGPRKQYENRKVVKDNELAEGNLKNMKSVM